MLFDPVLPAIPSWRPHDQIGLIDSVLANIPDKHSVIAAGLVARR
jgi:hypothetical protein